jgi:hypothetical protein
MIVTLAFNWKYTVNGETKLVRISDLASSIQFDIFSGREAVTTARNSGILPGSKRLITESGMFGDNTDVLPPPFGESGGIGGSRTARTDHEVTAVDLQLDVVFFEDGLCVGPDEFALFDNIVEQLEQQRSISQQIAEALRGGALRGHIFEMLYPLARREGSEQSPDGCMKYPANILHMFSNMAIHHLVHASDSDLLAWFEAGARPSPISLHRPS